MDESLNQVSKEAPPANPPAGKEVEGLRTYAGDFGKSINSERGDTIRRAIQEEERKAQAAKAQTLASRQNVMLLAGSILAVIVGIGAIIYLFIGSRPKVIEPANTKVPSIVFADASKEIPFAGLNKDQLIQAVRSAGAPKLSSGMIENIFFTELRGSVKYLTSAKGFLSLLSQNVPTLLTDGLENTFMFGVYGDAGMNAPFLIFKTDAYNDAFSGMREWESRLFDDTYQLLGIATTGDNSNLFEATFQDAVLKNKDARVLRSASNDISLLYAFVDEHTIVITTDPAALDEVALRLTSQKVEQAAL